MDDPALDALTTQALATCEPHVRPEVLSAMARGGDAAAFAELTRLADEAEPGSQLAMIADDAERRLRG